MKGKGITTITIVSLWRSKRVKNSQEDLNQTYEKEI